MWLNSQSWWKKNSSVKHLKFLFYTILLIAVSINQAIGEDQLTSQILDAVKIFCDFEFNGTVDSNPEARKQLVQFSDAKLEALTKTHYPEDPYIFSIEVDPMDIVDSYQIIKAEVGDSHDNATATVKYNVIARRTTEARPIHLVNETDSIVHLKLKLVNGKWIVINPIEPHVSRQEVSNYFRSKFSLSHEWYEKAGSGQWRVLRRYIDSILTLDVNKSSSENLPP